MIILILLLIWFCISLCLIPFYLQCLKDSQKKNPVITAAEAIIKGDNDDSPR